MTTRAVAARLVRTAETRLRAAGWSTCATRRKRPPEGQRSPPNHPRATVEPHLRSNRLRIAGRPCQPPVVSPIRVRPGNCHLSVRARSFAHESDNGSLRQREPGADSGGTTAGIVRTAGAYAGHDGRRTRVTSSGPHVEIPKRWASPRRAAPKAQEGRAEGLPPGQRKAAPGEVLAAVGTGRPRDAPSTARGWCLSPEARRLGPGSGARLHGGWGTSAPRDLGTGGPCAASLRQRLRRLPPWRQRARGDRHRTAARSVVACARGCCAPVALERCRDCRTDPGQRVRGTAPNALAARACHSTVRLPGRPSTGQPYGTGDAGPSGQRPRWLSHGSSVELAAPGGIR